MSDYFDRIEQHLLDAVERQASGRSGRGAVLKRSRPTMSRFSTVLSVALVLGSVSVAGVFLASLHPRRPSAAAPAVAHPGCGVAGAQRLYREGAPKSLLSILGVLRRAQDPADMPAPRIIARSFTGPRMAPTGMLPLGEKRSVSYVYWRYIRRARTYQGLTYWVAPVVLGADLADGRCVHPIAGVELAALSRGGAGSAGCCFDAAHILSGNSGGTNTAPGGGTILQFLVPDSVATVTIRFPTGPTHRLITETARPVGNVVAITFPAADTDQRARQPIWRAANGQIIRQIR